MSSRPRLEPFGTATRDLAAPCLERRLDSSLKRAAFICPDLNKKNWLIRRIGIYLLSNASYCICIYVGRSTGRSDLYTILTAKISIRVNNATSLSNFGNVRCIYFLLDSLNCLLFTNS